MLPSTAATGDGEEERDSRANRPLPSTHPSASASSGGRTRAPDMQLGKCRWIRVYDNVTYIVSGIVLRETDGGPEILLIKEAKKKCRGKWYMPAGHVEPGETIEQACKREVLEETGYECSVDQLICMEIRGSGWYRMSFACTITGGHLKTEPDRESLAAGWHAVDALKRRKTGATAEEDEEEKSHPQMELRCRDFLTIVEEALKYREWRKRSRLPPTPEAVEGGSCSDDPRLEDERRLLFAPLLNKDEPQPGLFIEFVVVKWNSASEQTECLVHGSITDEKQLLEDSLDPFPAVEFGFEFFFAMVVSKCYRHIFEDGHQLIDLPEAVLAMWCLPAPVESVRQGLRLRILCRHKRTMTRAPLCVPQRYRWLALRDRRVLAHLHLLPEQFRPALIML